MKTVRKLVASSLRLIGAIDPGEAPDAQEATDALDTLKDYLDSLPNQDLMLPFTSNSLYVTVPGQSSYSIGPGGDWDGIRPIEIKLATLRVSGVDSPLKQLSYEEYAAIPVKTTQSPQPDSFYYEGQYPLGRVVLYPVPTAEVGIILAQEATFAVVTLDTDISDLPPGYGRMLRYNLALELAPEYGKTVKQEVKDTAKSSKAEIKAKHSKSLNAKIDPRLPGLSAGGFDYRYG